MHKLVLLRHGESQWNLENRFTGWHDVNLTEQGESEGKEAGRLLKDNGFEFDVAYTSVLTRAIRTLWLALTEMNQVWIPVHREWRLNERHYGSLQGLNKAETAEKHGDEQVLIWRRSYDIPPPSMDKDDDGYAGKDRRYKNLSEEDIPLSECLKDTVDRFLPLWEETIAPQIKLGKQVLIAAHGNSLRALIKYLDNVSDEDILSMNVPTGMPLVYELDENLKPLSRQYLGDPEKLQKRWRQLLIREKRNKLTLLRFANLCIIITLHLWKQSQIPLKNSFVSTIQILKSLLNIVHLSLMCRTLVVLIWMVPVFRYSK